MIICIGDNHGQPEFGILKFICLYQNNILFVNCKLKTALREHENAYEVLHEIDFHEIIHYENLLHFQPLSLTRRFDRYFILLRSYL